MSQNISLKKLQEKLIDFQKTIEELRLLKQVAENLKSYRRMIPLKQYD